MKGCYGDCSTLSNADEDPPMLIGEVIVEDTGDKSRDVIQGDNLPEFLCISPISCGTGSTGKRKSICLEVCRKFILC